MIRRILEDIYGGTWGVLIIKNPNLISQGRKLREVFIFSLQFRSSLDDTRSCEHGWFSGVLFGCSESVAVQRVQNRTSGSG